ncbi:MAG: glycosyltransferase family 2 protein [Bradymonadia bacterium]
MRFDVIIPALDEEATIGDVVQSAIDAGARRIVVVDNGSIDQTPLRAAEAGADVIRENIRGYGQACLSGLTALSEDPPDWVLFCDGDGADDPKGLVAIVNSARHDQVDFVIGNRANRSSEPGALTLPQRFGNRLACSLIWLLYRTRFHDLGPLRMIKWETLRTLNMQDPAFGWTVEMQVKAAKLKVRFCEIDVTARCRRGGESKISGTIRGSVLAGITILRTIFKEAKTNV